MVNINILLVSLSSVPLLLYLFYHVVLKYREYLHSKARITGLFSAQYISGMLVDKSVVCSEVEIISQSLCGDGTASTSDRVNINLWLESTHSLKKKKKLPVVVKATLLPTFLRVNDTMASALAMVLRCAPGYTARAVIFKLVGAYQVLFPHAPDALYEAEAMFYLKVRPEIEGLIEAPHCFGATCSNRNFILVLEDLCKRGATFKNATNTLDMTQIQGLLSGLARMHAKYWRSPRFAVGQDLSWVPSRLSKGMVILSLTSITFL